MLERERGGGSNEERMMRLVIEAPSGSMVWHLWGSEVSAAYSGLDCTNWKNRESTNYLGTCSIERGHGYSQKCELIDMESSRPRKRKKKGSNPPVKDQNRKTATKQYS